MMVKALLVHKISKGLGSRGNEMVICERSGGGGVLVLLEKEQLVSSE